jgi:hypothetical protein
MLIGAIIGGGLLYYFFVMRRDDEEECADWKRSYYRVVDDEYVSTMACRFQYRDGMSKGEARDKAIEELEEEKRLNP